MCKVQIINLDGQLRYDPAHLAWVKQFVQNLQQYYPILVLNTLDIFDQDKLISIDADLYIYPVSCTKIKVCFTTVESNTFCISGLKKRRHKVTITNHANTKCDALSTFLILMIGLTLMPNSMGSINTDLWDLMTVLQKGKAAKIVNQDFFIEKNQKDIVSLLVWFNRKGKFSNNFYNLCAKVKNKLKSDNALAILNVTEHLTLKETMLAVVVAY